MQAIEKTDLPEGVIDVGGNRYVRAANGTLLPIESVKPQHLLEDETVRKIMAYAGDLSDRIARFRGHTFEDLSGLDALLEQQYGARRGGRKGNRTYQTIDGLMKVQVQVADLIDFGPELQIAKGLIDECLNEWSADAGPEIRAVVTKAFNTDKAGQINKAELFMLLRLEITDERWQRGMQAIRDAIRVTGSRLYVRFYKRKEPTGRWQAITIDLAKA